ncbi:MAG: heterodisulfide reductase-related iron-sulfur binding cluster [Candidatus Helarchaeota archaeon]
MIFVEMYRNRENAWCCGAGGGVKSGFPDLALKIAQTRINDAIETEATEIVTACPFCINNLKDAVNNLNNEKQIEILDILELILKSIK